MAAPLIDADKPTFETLLELIAALRCKQNGCPWDRKQTPSTITVYLIEEIFELVEAINADDSDGVLEELGDVLFQLFFIVYLYRQDERFSIEGILSRIIEKMIRRHPHVFESQKIENADQVKAQWRRIKQREKGLQDSLMDTVPSGMPALISAFRISERAAGTGFDWDSLAEVMVQVEQEWDELKTEMEKPNAIEANKSKITMELGDVLFSIVNVARLARIHPETALSCSTRKFIRRFKYMESMAAAENKSLEMISKDEMAHLWQKAKNQELSHE